MRAFQGQGSYSVQLLIDRDSDTRPDVEDNCPSALNPGQEDADGDRLGDACDRFPDDRANDVDRDGRGAEEDNCPRGGEPHPDRLGRRRPRRRLRPQQAT